MFVTGLVMSLLHCLGVSSRAGNGTDAGPPTRMGVIVSGSKISEPLSKWELVQESTERKRLVAMDEAFCASLAAAIRRGEEKELSARFTPT